MGYLHIENLYKNTALLGESRVYALEKIHGTSSHIQWTRGKPLRFFAGGVNHTSFVSLFDEPALTRAFEAYFGGIFDKTFVYGEAYGGKLQKMKETYGERLRFVAFDVRVGDVWLDVPQAEQAVLALGLEFVPYCLVPATLETLDFERDRFSVQAVRNGCGPQCKREGIVIRPVVERLDEFGERLIAKHKAADFIETKTPRRPGVAPEIITDAKRAAEEVVTEERLRHVLDKLIDCPVELTMADTKHVIEAMLEDVYREEGDQLTGTDAEKKVISSRTAQLFKRLLGKR